MNSTQGIGAAIRSIKIRLCSKGLSLGGFLSVLRPPEVRLRIRFLRSIRRMPIKIACRVNSASTNTCRTVLSVTQGRNYSVGKNRFTPVLNTILLVKHYEKGLGWQRSRPQPGLRL